MGGWIGRTASEEPEQDASAEPKDAGQLDSPATEKLALIEQPGVQPGQVSSEPAASQGGGGS